MQKPNGSPTDGSRPRTPRKAVSDPLLPGMPLDQIGQALASAYDNLVAEGVPEHLAALVRRVKSANLDRSSRSHRLALVVEDDSEVRALAEAVLDETELSVIGCDSAERALAVLQERGGDIALVFADIRLAGAMDGVQLANAIATLWPKTRLVVTSGVSLEEYGTIPAQAVFIPKPWRALDVLVEAERAADDLPPAVA